MGHFAQPVTNAELLSDRHVAKAVHALKAGTSLDALGWTKKLGVKY